MLKIWKNAPNSFAVSDQPLALGDHLEELRRRLGFCLLVFILSIGVAFTQIERLLDWLKYPAAALLPQLVFFHPAEPLSAYIKLATLGGLLLAMPVILWQVWGFVRIALSRREQLLGIIFVSWGSFQFFAGVAFAYFFLLPVSLKFLLSIGSRQLQPMISIDAYLSFVISILGWSGLIFELPVVLLILAKVGIVTTEWLRQQRAYAVLALVVIAAVITPTTDPVNLLLMALPLVALYEGAIMITRLAMTKKPNGGG